MVPCKTLLRIDMYTHKIRCTIYSMAGNQFINVMWLRDNHSCVSKAMCTMNWFVVRKKRRYRPIYILVWLEASNRRIIAFN